MAVPPARAVVPCAAFRRWAIHRDSNERYLRHIRGMLTSVTWRNLQRPLTGVMLLSTLNCAYQQAYDLHALPPSFPQLLLSDGAPSLGSLWRRAQGVSSVGCRRDDGGAASVRAVAVPGCVGAHPQVPWS